jgi:Divergent InlB B-repeat domain
VRRHGIVIFAATAAAFLAAPVAQAVANQVLTLTKSPSVSSGKGTGSVSSKPQGIKCGATCSKAVASLYKGANVALAAKPSMGSTFVEWTGACSGPAPTCTVKMDEAKEVGAVFGGTSKAFSPAEALTVSKGESTGQGTVKVYGSLTCEAACTETTNYYQGPIAEKGKPGRTVVLEQKPAFGSEFSGWSGCDEVTEAGYCVVTMESNRKVTAEYTALPNVDLTVQKSAYANGGGKVISKPKGINCAATCTTQSAAMPEGVSVTLTAKPGKETELVEWQGGDCDEGKSLTCTVTMDEAEEVTAVFKGPVRKIEPAETLTLDKVGSGYGTVKAAGLICEALCTSVSVLYQGPTVEKSKPGKIVILKGVAALGSKAVEWSGCGSIDEEGNCVVTMEGAKEVTATFDELE